MRIVTTIFPIYDWVLNILGENPAEADVTMLLDTGVDFHSFQPSAEEILIVQNTRTKDQQILTMDSMQATNAEEDAEICVVGLFDTYQEGDATYCTLRNAKML